MKIKNLKCPNCGARVNTNQKKCDYCGASIYIKEDENSSLQNNNGNLTINLSSLNHNKINQKKVSKIACIMGIFSSILMIILPISFIISFISNNKNSHFGFNIAEELPFIIGPCIPALIGVVILITSITMLIKLRKKNKEDNDNKEK